jgi:hypothetical protein
MLSPFGAVVLFAVLFVAGVRKKKNDAAVLWRGYVRHVLTGAGWCLAATIVYVFGITAYYNSPQGPLTLIFFGPAAVSLGGVIGAVVWIVKPFKPPRYKTVIRRFPKGRGTWDAEFELTGAALESAQRLLQISDPSTLSPLWKIPVQSLGELGTELQVAFDRSDCDYYLCPRERAS